MSQPSSPSSIRPIFEYNLLEYRALDDPTYRDKAPEDVREAKWRENGYTVISMKNDFKTIYGPEVKKVDFVY